MQKTRMVVCGLVVLLVAAAGVFVGSAKGRAQSRSAAREVEDMARLAQNLGDTVVSLRKEYRAAQEQIEFLERNNQSLGRNLIDSQADAAELAIRTRELAQYIGELEQSLTDAGIPLSAVAEEIGRIIRSAEELAN